MKNLMTGTAIAACLAGPIWAQSVDPAPLQVGVAQTIEVAGFDLAVDQVQVPERGGILLSGATLTRPDRDGYVLIRQLEMTDPDLLGILLDPKETCDPTQAVSGELTAREVRFRPDSDLGVPAGQEEVRIPVLTLDLSRIGCSWQLSGAADGVVISGVDGSRIDITTIEARARLSGSTLETVDARVDLYGIGLDGVSGPGGIRADEAGFSFTADLSETGLLQLASRKAPTADLISAASDTVLRGGVYLRGLELIPDLFLPERDLLRVGLAEREPITGNLELTGSIELGKFRMRGAADLSGVVRGEASLSGALPTPGGVSVPEAISGSVPIPAELIGLTLDRAAFSYQDLGFGAIVQTLSGKGPADLLSETASPRMERLKARLPGGLPATLQAVWDLLITTFRDGSGSGGVRPEQPFSLLELAISGMMGPSMAASRTGAWSE